MPNCRTLSFKAFKNQTQDESSLDYKILVTKLYKGLCSHRFWWEHMLA